MFDKEYEEKRSLDLGEDLNEEVTRVVCKILWIPADESFVDIAGVPELLEIRSSFLRHMGDGDTALLFMERACKREIDGESRLSFPALLDPNFKVVTGAALRNLRK